MFLEYNCSLWAGCAHGLIVSKKSENPVKQTKKPFISAVAMISKF